MADQPNRYTLAEAARLTGLSTEALRLRIRRGKLASEKGNDGLRIILTAADLEGFVAGQERQQISTERIARPNESGALEASVANLVDLIGQDRTAMKTEMAALQMRADAAETKAAAALAIYAEAKLQAAVLVARLEAAEAALARERDRAERVEAVARRAWWKRLIGQP